MRPWVTTLAALFLAASVAHAMEFEDVLQLLHAGVGEDVILAQVEAEDAGFVLDTDSILALKQAGASDHLIRELIAAGDRDQDEEWQRGYYGTDYYGRTGTAVALGYDPFGYYWYGAPYYFAYYYPFRTIDIGFYYAGWYNRGWWGWYGYWPSYYRDYCYWNYRHCDWWWHDDDYHHDWNRYEDRAGRDAWTRGSGSSGRSWDRSVDRTRSTTRVAPERTPRQPSAPRDRDRSWTRSRDRDTRPDRVATPPRTPPSRTPAAPPTRSAPSRSRSEGASRGGGWRR